MSITHVFVTRPQPAADELARLLEPLGLEVIVQPAFVYRGVDARADQAEAFAALAEAGPGDLLVFTSPRAVQHGLPQIPRQALATARVAAIGPSSTRALERAGVPVDVSPAEGYTSEALLSELGSEFNAEQGRRCTAWIIAAPGGRDKLSKDLGERGWRVVTVMVYRAEAAPLDKGALGLLQDAGGILSVWTSANTMHALAQRLPPAAWFRLCQGEWLVISERLRRAARAYGPGAIHLATGPDNESIAAAIRGLVRKNGRQVN